MAAADDWTRVRVRVRVISCRCGRWGQCGVSSHAFCSSNTFSNVVGEKILHHSNIGPAVAGSARLVATAQHHIKATQNFFWHRGMEIAFNRFESTALLSLAYLATTCLLRKAWTISKLEDSECYLRQMTWCCHQTARIRKAV